MTRDEPGLTEADLDRLADYGAGVLDADEADAVASLVATDPRWAAVYAQLAGADAAVARLLRADHDDDALPADVAARLDVAFGGAPRATVVPLSSARRQLRRRARTFALALGAAAAVAVVVGGFASGSLTVRKDGSADTAAGGAQASDVSPESALTRDNGKLDGVPVTSTGFRYDYATLPLAASSVSGSADKSYSTFRALAGAPTELGSLMAPAALRACLEAVAAYTGGSPARAEFATYDDHPALVVVVTLASGSRVVAVGSECAAGNPDVQAVRTLP